MYIKHILEIYLHRISHARNSACENTAMNFIIYYDKVTAYPPLSTACRVIKHECVFAC